MLTLISVYRIPTILVACRVLYKNFLLQTESEFRLFVFWQIFSGMARFVLPLYFRLISRCITWPHQRLSSSELKTSRRKVPGSILGHACRPGLLEFTMVLFRNSRKYGQDNLERSPWRASHLKSHALRVSNCTHTQTPNRCTIRVSFSF